MSEPKLYDKAREFLRAAGYDVSDPECRALVALVNLGCRKANCDSRLFPTGKIRAAFYTRMSFQLKKIGKLVIEAKLAGVKDVHLATVPAAVPDKDGRSAWGALLYDPELGWRYVPPGRTYLSVRATHRLAVISCLQSAIWEADVEGRKIRGRRRRRIVTIKP